MFEIRYSDEGLPVPNLNEDFRLSAARAKGRRIHSLLTPIAEDLNQETVIITISVNTLEYSLNKVSPALAGKISAVLQKLDY